MASSSSLRSPLASLLASSSKALPRASISARHGVSNLRSMATQAPGPHAQILKGMDEFLPKESFDTIQKWQGGLWKRLESELQNQPELVTWQNARRGLQFSITDLIVYTARDPSLSLAYNYASLILNTSFFLEGLSAQKQVVPSSFEELEDQVVGRAKGMAGSGWLWLVKAGNNVEVLSTYSSGTLLVRSHSQLGGDNLQDVFHPSPSSILPSMTLRNSATANLTENKDYTTSSKDLMPLAVLSLYEHAYVGASKYGVWGKERYARDWFRSLDWDTVGHSSF